MQAPLMQRRSWIALAGSTVLTPLSAFASQGQAKKRILIISSYSRDYLWSQSTQQGVNAAMLKYGYLDSEAQANALIEKDEVESARSIVRKYWMDTKR
ncbi:MAG: hypothetical protein K9K38_08890, partial [Rhodoferax sp.]|nr:hypothetical protein [Rhodoferax sp.]